MSRCPRPRRHRSTCVLESSRPPSSYFFLNPFFDYLNAIVQKFTWAIWFIRDTAGDIDSGLDPDCPDCGRLCRHPAAGYNLPDAHASTLPHNEVWMLLKAANEMMQSLALLSHKNQAHRETQLHITAIAVRRISYHFNCVASICVNIMIVRSVHLLKISCFLSNARQTYISIYCESIIIF